MPNRAAIPVFFGFDFQVNAAIVLMIENIRELTSLKLESENEDIDLTLKSGAHILAQAKSVENSSNDFSHVRRNMRKSLISLSEGYRRLEEKKTTVDKLIFVTNSPNPFGEKTMSNAFYGPSHRDFITLPESCRKFISDCLVALDNPLEPDKLMVQVVPFETDNEHERYKVVMQTINDFVGDLNIDAPGLGRKLHTVWCHDIFKNGSKHKSHIKQYKT